MGMELEIDENSRGLTEEGILHIPGLLSRWVRLANGAKAHYVTAGEDGPAVILLHGGIVGSSGTAGFRFMATMLGANGFRVYCPDRPGYGLADTSREDYLDYDPKAQIDFINMFADALCLDKFHLSGNSAGCVTSVQYAVHNPERVLSLALIAGWLGDICEAPVIFTKDGKFTPDPSYKMPPFDGSAESMQTLMDGIIYKAAAIWPELVEMRVRSAALQKAARPDDNFEKRMRALVNPSAAEKVTFTTKHRLGMLDFPIIYLYGLEDVVTPVENGFNQEDSAPFIQFFYPFECGHQGQTDQPEMVNQLFLEFFRDGKVSWETAKWAGVSRRHPIKPHLVEEPEGGFPPPIPEAYTDIETLRAALGK